MKPHNYIPEDYQKHSILVRVGGKWYHARQCGTKWNVYQYLDAKINDFDAVPVAPWILIENGETVSYSGVSPIAKDITKAEVWKVLESLQVPS